MPNLCPACLFSVQRTITIKSTSVSMVFDVPTRIKQTPRPGVWSKEQAEAAALAKLEAQAGLALPAANKKLDDQPQQQQQQAETSQQPQPVKDETADLKDSAAVAGETKTDKSAADSSEAQTESGGERKRVEVLPYLVNLID